MWRVLFLSSITPINYLSFVSGAVSGEAHFFYGFGLLCTVFLWFDFLVISPIFTESNQ
jgi:hypothetical protein